MSVSTARDPQALSADPLVGIRFRPAGRIYYYLPRAFTLKTGQWVMVETAKGVECGRVVVAPRQVRAIEEDDYGRLPGRTFVRVFVRNYARLVTLDP